MQPKPVAVGVTLALLLCASAWWWVTWPERTARKFRTLVLENKFHEAAEILDKPRLERREIDPFFSQMHWDFKSQGLRLARRGRADWLAGRRTFRFDYPNGWTEFTVQRGHVWISGGVRASTG